MSIYRQYMVIAPKGINFLMEDLTNEKQIKDNTFLARLFSRYPTNLDYPKNVKYKLRLTRTPNRIRNYKVQTFLRLNNNNDSSIIEKMNKKAFVVLYSSEVGCRESSTFYTDAYLNFIKEANINFSRIKIVFEVTNINSTNNKSILSEHYSKGVKTYVDLFAKRQYIYKEIDNNSRERIVHNFMLNHVTAGEITVAVSCLGFLFGSHFHYFKLGKNTLSTSKIKGRNFKEKLINSIMKGQKKSNPNMTSINSAFFLDALAKRNNMGIKVLKAKEQHNGIATFSKLVANFVHPELYIDFLNKYKIDLNSINVDRTNSLWFSSWQDIENLFKLKSKGKTSW